MEAGKIKLHWGTHCSKELRGNGYGYRSHNSSLFYFVKQIAEITDDAEDSVIIVSPEFYKNRIAGKVNWLFTMFEGTDLPKIYADEIQKADYLLTPSTWVQELFKKYFDPEKVFVVPHGVTPDYTFKQRLFPVNRPFRFLWVGAPNPRKGWEEITAVWFSRFVDNPEVELYLKTTTNDGSAGTLIRKSNVIKDTRDLIKRDLIKLYHSADCFVFPTRGEGFGLTLAEAMRTGLPCIAPLYSGVTDFFDAKVGFPITHRMGKMSMTFLGGRKGERTYITEGAMPDVEHLYLAMETVRTQYKFALDQGKKASERISKHFTWDQSARILVDTIKEHGGLKKNDIAEKERSVHIQVKKNKKIITMTAFKRPEYTRKVLDGLSKCKKIEEYVLMPHVEPGNQEVIDMIKGVDFTDCDYVINTLKWDINENTFRALSHGFMEGDYIIHLEDDTVPAPDMLLYFEQMKHIYETDKDVLTICGYNKYEKQEVDEKDYYLMYRKQWFTPWGWATWKDRWEEIIEPRWHDNMDKWAWGEYLNHSLRKEKFEIRPVLGRIQNIGAKEGRFNPSEEYHRENQYNEIWAGGLDIPFEEFREAEVIEDGVYR